MYRRRAYRFEEAITSAILVFTLLCWPVFIGATPAAKRDVPTAHEHGKARLNVVFAGDELVIELEVPGVNVVGFEHPAHSDSEKRAVSKALRRFKEVGSLFRTTPAATCNVESLRVRLGDSETSSAPSIPQHEHGHDGSRETSGDDAHSVLLAEYHLHCGNPGALQWLDVSVFPHLLGTESIIGQLATELFQTRIQLRPGDERIRLAR
jgi:hypothetical protein